VSTRPSQSGSLIPGQKGHPLVGAGAYCAVSLAVLLTLPYCRSGGRDFEPVVFQEKIFGFSLLLYDGSHKIDL
jgi:hypothetical protein